VVNRLLGWRARDSQRPVIIVSGLPRSGTSLMMQMLEAGGVPVLTDHRRPPDASNPRGYYEFEPVKRLGKEPATWMTDASGHALKVVSPLLVHLPAEYAYRVVFMLRDLDEVILSQRAMLERGAALSGGFDGPQMRGEYESHLASVRLWLNRQTNMRVLYVDHRRVFEDTEAVVAELEAHLGSLPDVDAVPQVIDRRLYRQRRADRP
jgi:hypothetical protein